jgi:hypothetical protein
MKPTVFAYCSFDRVGVIAPVSKKWKVYCVRKLGIGEKYFRAAHKASGILGKD